MSHSHLIPHNKAIDFIIAGNAIFTFKNKVSGVRFTFKCFMKDEEDIIRIGLLTGSDNTVFSPMAILSKDEGGMPVIKRDKRSWIKEDSPAIKCFRFCFFNLLIEREMPTLEIWHEGRCCRCGRTLTVPESIEAGIGPECITKINRFKL